MATSDETLAAPESPDVVQDEKSDPVAAAPEDGATTAMAEPSSVVEATSDVVVVGDDVDEAEDAPKDSAPPTPAAAATTVSATDETTNESESPPLQQDAQTVEATPTIAQANLEEETTTNKTATTDTTIDEQETSPNSEAEVTEPDNKTEEASSSRGEEETKKTESIPAKEEEEVKEKDGDGPAAVAATTTAAAATTAVAVGPTVAAATTTTESTGAIAQATAATTSPQLEQPTEAEPQTIPLEEAEASAEEQADSSAFVDETTLPKAAVGIAAATTAATVSFADDVDEPPFTSHSAPMAQEPSFRRLRDFRQSVAWKNLAIEEHTTRHCFPKGFTLHLVPLCTSVAALAFTGAGSWDCSYFSGAHIDFTGNHFGLWTLEDSSGKCQLWDVLFFAFDLGPPLIAARVFSMTAMLLGLSLTATMAQASQFHLASWGIGLALLLLFIVSVSTTSIFNVWVVFWLFSYAIMVLIIRYLFIHPVPRRISARGAKIISGLFLMCSVCCLLTMVVLTSDYCTCSGLTTERLDGRDPGEPCNGTCELGPAGYAMIAASVCYIAAAVCCLKIGIQPEELKHNLHRPDEWYAHYPQQSIVTRFKGAMDSLISTASASSAGDLSLSTTSNNSAKKGGDTSFTSHTKTSMTGALDSIKEQEHESSALGEDGTPKFFGMSSNFKEEEEEEEVVFVVDEEGPDEEEPPEEKPNGLLGGDDDEDKDDRGCCQKCCCDFRVIKRSRHERYIFWTFRTLLGFGLVIYGLFIYLMIGSRIENTRSAKQPDTTPFFTMDAVCAYNPDNPNQPFETFVNRDAAKARGWTVAHCGKCGECSNPHDIITYVETRKTIAQSSKSCGPNVYLGTYEDVADCLEEKIGFTRPCTNCWADNMVSTGEKCLSTCLRTLFSGFMTDNNVPGAGEQGWMNQCLFCDEKRSGPAFVTCSGVARRRLGIVSEIERNPEEQCKRMDIDWVNVDWDEIGFEKTQI